MTTSNLKKIKRQTFARLIMVIIILILLNILGQFFYHRFDLTKDKRFSLSKPTKDLIRTLDDIVYIKVYLDGELPSGFRRLKESTRELLDEYKAYAGKKLEYDFFDPSESKNEEDRKNLYNQLMEQGLQPIKLMEGENDQKKQKIIFPGAIVTYKNKSLPLSLLQQQLGLSPEEVIHNSIISLEYEFSNTIKKSQITVKPRIAFIEGHGELDKEHTADIYSSLSQYYEVTRLNLPYSKIGILANYDAIIIAKPDSGFRELEKYEIDQFVMRGGKAIWFIDMLMADMDSLDKSGMGVTLDYALNLDDLFFKYGFRIYPVLVEDLSCQYIPLLTSSASGGAQRDFRLWPYYPLVFPGTNHPIVNNLNGIWFRFANIIDTIKSPAIKKTILLQTSEQSRLKSNPVKISLDQIADINYPEIFNKGPQNLAVLLEGTFRSLYTNRPIPTIIPGELQKKFMAQSKPNKMIVVADGDIISNNVSRSSGTYYPLGFDPYTKQTFGNKIFVQNCIDFLLDESNLMQLRTKHFKLRLLDKTKYKGKEIKWQVINLGLPILIVAVFGFIFNFLRKRKYGSI